MTARKHLPESHVLRLFDPSGATGESAAEPPETLHIGQCSDPSGHRIPNPVSHPPAAESTSPAQPAPAIGLADLFAEVAAEHQDAVRLVPEADRQLVRESLTLSEFHAEWMAPVRRKQMQSGQLSKGTWEKELQALRRYTDWDANPDRRPAKWPAGVAWTGLPIGYLTGPWLDRWIAALAASGLAQDTVESTWYQLRTVLNFAVKVKALDTAPKPAGIKQYYEADDDLFAEVWNLDEVAAIYRQLAGSPQLQTAFVVSVNAGPRPRDLFALRWGTHVRLDQERPEIWYTAVKTGKRHFAPLAPCTVAHLERLRKRLLVSDGQLVFPRLTSAKNRDPEKSKAARRRNAAIKAAIAEAGLEVPVKPWQQGRSTCNTRLNAVPPGGIGKLMLHGRDMSDVNSRSYDGAMDRIREAVLAIEQPAEFLALCG